MGGVAAEGGGKARLLGELAHRRRPRRRSSTPLRSTFPDACPPWSSCDRHPSASSDLITVFVQILQQDSAAHLFFRNEGRDFVNRHIITGDISDDGTSRLLRSDAMTSTFQIIPLQPGRLELMAVVTFPDQGMAFQKGNLDVLPTSEDLIYFRLSSTPSVPIVLTGDPSKDTRWLSPSVRYTTLNIPSILLIRPRSSSESNNRPMQQASTFCR